MFHLEVTPHYVCGAKYFLLPHVTFCAVLLVPPKGPHIFSKESTRLIRTLVIGDKGQFCLVQSTVWWNLTLNRYFRLQYSGTWNNERWQNTFDIHGSLLYIRMLLFRPRLNIFIFLSILGWKLSWIILKNKLDMFLMFSERNNSPRLS